MSAQSEAAGHDGPASIIRWACDCGRFIAGSSIRSEDFRDDSYYYGIRTETRFTCSRCGVIEDEPRLVVARL